MKVTKQEIQVVVTPPPTYTVEGLTEFDVAVLKALTSNSMAVVRELSTRNTFIRDNSQKATGVLLSLKMELDKAEERGVWPLKSSFEQNRDRGDETKS